MRSHVYFAVFFTFLKARLLVKFFTDSLGSAGDAGTIANDISDHFINFFFVPTTKVVEKTKELCQGRIKNVLKNISTIFPGEM